MNRKAFIPISALMGALLLALFVGVFSAAPFGERNVAYAQASDDARLSSLSITNVVFMSPRFDAATEGYRARVSSSTATVSVSATARNSQSMVDIEISDGTANDPGMGRKTQSITLEAAGSSTTITVDVEPPSGDTDTKRYSIVVFRESSASPAAAALLTDWTLNTASDGTGTDVLTGISVLAGFKASTANVAHDVSKLYLTADGSTNSHIRVEGLHYNGSIPTTARVPIDLNGKGMKTEFTITVTAEAGAPSNTYTVTAYRYRNPQSNVNTLDRLSLGSGISLMPSFASGTTEYKARVPYDIGDGTVTYTLTDNAGGAMAAASGATADGTAIDDADAATSAYDFRLAAGAETTINVLVTPERGPGTPAETCDTATPEYVKCYEVVVYRENLTKSDVKTLAATTAVVDASDGSTSVIGSVAFAPDVTEYTNNAVANTVSRVTVTPVLTNATGGATSVIDPPDAASDDGHQVNLVAGQVTTITITVTAEDGSMQTYTINLYRMRSATELSDDARLKSLRVTDSSDMDQTLDPEFDSDKTMYNVRVANSVSVVTIVPETVEFGANYAFQDATDSPLTDSDGTVSGHQVSLPAAGVAPIEVNVVVTPENSTATTKTYTIMLYRQSATLSDNANLAASTDTPPGLTLTPAGTMAPTTFAPSTTAYRVVVGNGVPSVTVVANPAHAGASVDIMPDDADSGNSGHQVIATVGEETEFTITVTAEDGMTMKTYTFMLYRERAPRSDDATLSALSLNNAMLSPDFSPDVMTYTASAAYSAGERTMLTYAIDAGAKMIEVRAGRSVAAADAGTALSAVTRSSADVRLYNTGETIIRIKVFAENSTGEGTAATNTKTYTITVSRASEPSSDATLSSLSLKHLPMNKMEGESIDLSPMFDSGTMAYSADAGDEEMITVTAKAMHSAAMVSSVTVNGNAAMMTDIPTYWDMLGCPAMNDSVRMYDDHDHPDSPDSPYCTTYHMDATHPGLMGDAKAVVDMTFADYYDVPLMIGDNTISVMVTAEDGETTGTYTVMVTRGDAPADGVCALYDSSAKGGNGNGMIDVAEAVQAVQDYQNGDLELGDAVQVVLCFQGN